MLNTDDFPTLYTWDTQRGVDEIISDLADNDNDGEIELSYLFVENEAAAIALATDSPTQEVRVIYELRPIIALVPPKRVDVEIVRLEAPKETE
jgi:hypothetical protein